MDITMNLRSMNMKTSKPAPAIGSSHDSLFDELREMIAASRSRLASTVNSELTRLYWTIGERLRREELGGERAAYGAKVVARQGEKLAAEFGRGFEARNLRRMIHFVESFPDHAIVSTLSTKLNWSQFVELLAIPTEEARLFYAHACVESRWNQARPDSVRPGDLHGDALGVGMA